MDVHSCKQDEPDSNLVDSFSFPPDTLDFDKIFNDAKLCHDIEKLASKFTPINDCSRCILFCYQIFFALLYRFRRSEEEYLNLNVAHISFPLYSSFTTLRELLVDCSDERF